MPMQSPNAPPTDTAHLSQRIKSLLHNFAVGRGVRTRYRFIAWEPFPEYRTADTPAWRMMEAILLRLKRAAADKPLVIAPVFYDSYIRYRLARNYWDRFSSLAKTPGIHAIDLLPHFRGHKANVDRCFLVDDVHFSVHGHLILAEALQQELQSLRLLPGEIGENGSIFPRPKGKR